jgi:hypothetical protein
MKRKRIYFWASTPAVTPELRPISWNSKKRLFPSCNTFLRAFFPRANEQIASFCSGAPLRFARFNSSSLIASGVI